MSSGASTNNRRGEILPAIETILETAKASVAGLGVVGLEAAIGGVLTVVTALKNVRGNDESLRSFLDGIQRFNNTITYIRKVALQAKQGIARSDLEERLASFVKDLEAMAARAKEPLRSGLGRKFLMNKEYTSVVNQLNTDLHRAIQEFMMKGGAATEAAVEEILQSVQAGFSATRDDVKTAHTELSNELSGVSERVYRTQLGVQELSQHTRTWSDNVATSLSQMDVGLVDGRKRAEAAALNQHLLLLPRAQARYDSQSRQGAHGCLEGTRKKVLEEIYDWINRDDPDSPRILWLCGLAGIGKSTIAHTIAEEADADRRLGASFFFSRDEADRRNPQLVYPTIASQLARLDHELKKLVAAAVEQDHDVGTLVMRKQFEKLISEPLAAWTGTKDTIVIVMDALDECSPESGAEEILIRWAAELPKTRVPLKVLITSRPEFHIRARFQSLSLRTISKPYILHDIENSVVKEDIELFLRDSLHQIAEEHGIQTPWPSEPALRKLVDRAGILFIFASTAIKFFQSGKRRDPETRLELLLKEGPSKGGSQYRDVDMLYAQVLQYALLANEEDAEFDDIENLQEAFSIVLGAIVLIRDPLSSESLDSLLSLKQGLTRKVLLHLHSVLIVPESTDSEIRLLHPSFHDFLTSPERCPDRRLRVDPQENHARLAEGCLNILLDGLKHDPCNIGNLWLANADIPDLQNRLLESIPLHLRYACRYFTFHLSQASPGHKILADLVVSFCDIQLLMWVETLSLLGEVDNAMLSLQGLQDWYKNVTSPLRETIELLHDANRMLLESGQAIRRSSGHIYTSVLPFSPPCRLKQQYGHALRSNYIVHGLPTCWGQHGLTIDLPGTAQSITYSPDGTLVVVGIQSHGVYILNSSTGAEIETFKDFGGTTPIVFSPDGLRIAYAVGNKAYVRDVTTGAQLVTFEGHTEKIQDVAFASNGIQAITGSEDGTLGIWDSHTGQLLSRHSSGWQGPSAFGGQIGAITLSPDKLTIARTVGHAVEIWDWHHKYPLRTLVGDCEKVYFLHGNSKLLTAPSWAFGGDLTIWDYHVGTMLKSVTIDGDFHVSPFGPLLVDCDTVTGEVRVWNTETWHIVGRLVRGETVSRTSSAYHGCIIAFSPNGRTLVQSSSGGYLIVREISSDHLGPGGSASASLDTGVRLEAFAVSGDGSRVIGCWLFQKSEGPQSSRGAELRVWDVVNGGWRSTELCGPPFMQFRLASSPDGRLFMDLRTTYDALSTISVWDSDKLEVLITAKQKPRAAWLIRFSSNSSLLAIAYDTLPNPGFVHVQVLCTASLALKADLKVSCGQLSNLWEMEFVKGDTHLLFGIDLACQIWDINTTSCLFTFDAAKVDGPSTTPYPYPFHLNHIMTLRSWSTTLIVRFPEFITVERVSIDRFAPVQLVDGKPIFLPIRDGMLWEFDGLKERPLCWLPARWRERQGLIWSGPISVWGLDHDIGVLNMESLRKECTSIWRERVK